MKKTVLCLLGCWMVFSGCRQPVSTWTTSVPEAEAQAKKENKLVLLNFTGSDWCAACKVLDSDIFFKKAFSNYAEKNLVLVMLDYPFTTKLPDPLVKANEELKDKYKISGYPTLIALKPDGTVVWSNGGVPEGGLAGLTAKLDEAKKK